MESEENQATLLTGSEKEEGVAELGRGMGPCPSCCPIAGEFHLLGRQAGLGRGHPGCLCRSRLPLASEMISVNTLGKEGGFTLFTHRYFRKARAGCSHLWEDWKQTPMAPKLQ